MTVTCCEKYRSGFEFAQEEIEQAVKNKRLLSMEIEFSQKCNFRCPYCYVPEHTPREGELTKEELKDVIAQAVALGAKKIIILGGEPMIYPNLMEMVRYIRDLGARVELFTNGSRLTTETAKELFALKVKVVMKMNTFDKKLQDILSGRKGANKIIEAALNSLLAAGYPSDEKLLGISTIICRDNVDELPDMWRWLRKKNIEPYFEMITPQGSATNNVWLSVDLKKTQELFETIAEIDRIEFGHDWDPQPPLVGSRCLRHQFSCLVNSYGIVMPCVGVTIPVGDVRKRKLKDIIADSEVIQDLRDYRHTIKGPCAKCENADHCYGCRGAAYQITGDYLASDPMCWRNRERLGEIESLPLDVADMIPQHPPMKLADSLIAVSGSDATVDFTVSADCPFVDSNGFLDESAYLEIIAQAIATLHGFRTDRHNTNKIQGLLLGAKRLEIFGNARVGEVLRSTISRYAEYGDFVIIKGTVSRNGSVLAQGELKVWRSLGGVSADALEGADIREKRK
ncbi:MAG: radical SAM protein [Lentisphaerae bacterium]|nr:radical SAM protein [Lentisphaerota bacterium]